MNYTKVRMTPTIANALHDWNSRRKRELFGIQTSFSQVDEDGDGRIELEEFKKAFPQVNESEVEKMFNDADTNHDGKLDRIEYVNWMRRRAFDFARSLILPQHVVANRRKLSYTDQYSCLPPPIFMFVISAIQLSIFAYHSSEFVMEGYIVQKYAPVPVNSTLIYIPQKRVQVWRFITYMFAHSGYMHIILNVLMQLVLGVLLEMVHKWWRVLIIYFAGGLAGSLASSILIPATGLLGASGGAYALIFAHMSTVILNWPQMEYPWIRVLLFGAFAAFDIGMAIYYDYKNLKTSVPVHLGGGIAGLLVGIVILRNLKEEKWEINLRYFSFVLAVGLFLFAIGWHLFNNEYFRQK